jgi:3-phenylpropionate/trans-cinnamate dioxygenase ferredoxin component
MPQEHHWHFAIAVDKLEDDVATEVVLGGRRIAICKFENGFYAFGNICTHEYACLSDGFLEGKTIECPLHQARFDVTTGEALSPPAVRSLERFDVSLRGDQLFVSLPV